MGGVLLLRRDRVHHFDRLGETQLAVRVVILINAALTVRKIWVSGKPVAVALCADGLERGESVTAAHIAAEVTELNIAARCCL